MLYGGLYELLQEFFMKSESFLLESESPVRRKDEVHPRKKPKTGGRS